MIYWNVSFTVSLQKQPAKQVCGSGCERASSQHFTSNHRGKNSSSCVPALPLVCAGAEDCRPCQTRVCAVMLSLESCFTSMCTLTKTHIALNAWPPSGCDMESTFHSVLLVFKLSVSCNFRAAMAVIDIVSKVLLALAFAAILRSLFFQQKPSYLTWKYENTVVESLFFFLSKAPFFFFVENTVIHQICAMKKEAMCMFTQTIITKLRHTTGFYCFYIHFFFM